MTPEEREFWNGCKKFKDYKNIDEYIADIRRWLTLSSWQYGEDTANYLIKMNMNYIKEAYAAKEPVDDSGPEVGYCCG